MSATVSISTLLNPIWRSLAWVSVLIVLCTAQAFAGQVTLAWDASSGSVAGYKVHYGTSSGVYSSNINVTNTTATIANLVDGSTYYFAIKAYDSAGNESGFSNEASRTIAFAVPSASFSANITSGVAPLTVTFANSSTGNVTGWLWNFGDGTTSADKTPSKAYSNAGTYTVSLTATGPGGSNTATKTGYISVNKPTTTAPSATFNATPTSGAAPLLVTLTDTSTGTIASRLWDLGDGTTSTAQSIAKTYSAAGTYNVRLTVTNASGSTTTTKTISATATAPVANFSATPTSGIAPLTVQFSDSSTNATSWSWNFGDGNTSTLQNPSNTYLKAGTFTASLIASGPGGASTVKTVTITAKAAATTLPAPWLNKDIGNVGLAGSAGYASGIYTLKGAGLEIWGTTDAFQFAYQTLNGDGSIVARVTGLTSTNSEAKAGVMIRESLDANARHAMAVMKPTGYTSFQRRTTQGGATASQTSGRQKVPYWVKLTRAGNSFTSHVSTDGKTWTQLGSTITISMASSVYVGLAVSSRDTNLLNTATFDNVNLRVGNIGTGSLPNPWLGADIGNAGLAGAVGYTNGAYTLKGSGADIGNTVDAFHFAYQPLNGNGTIVARVTGLTNTNSEAKAGVMIRESLDANARHAMMIMKPTGYASFQRRTTQGGATASQTSGALGVPYWVKLTRSNSSLSAYISADGSIWRQLGSTITISMASSVYVGLVVTSHDNSLLNTATFDNVKIMQ